MKSADADLVFAIESAVGCLNKNERRKLVAFVREREAAARAEALGKVLAIVASQTMAGAFTALQDVYDKVANEIRALGAGGGDAG